MWFCPAIWLRDTTPFGNRYVLGTEGMRRMATADILVSGLGGLGVEVAKNIILAGVRSVTLYDPNPVSWSDLSSHFFAGADDIGHGKAEVSKHKLAELNNHVSVHVLNKPKITAEDIRKFTVVVLTQGSHETCLEIGKACHDLGVKFVAAATSGVFGKVFCDFGTEFVVSDPTGEDPPSVMVQQIEKKPYADAFSQPEFLVTDFTKFDRPPQIHLCFAALSDYAQKHKGAYPGTWNQSDAQEFIQCVRSLNTSLKDTGAFVSELDEHLCSLFAYTSNGQCCPVQAVIGGFAAQEALKACTGKFKPLMQWSYFDAIECLPSPVSQAAENCSKELVVGEGDAAPRGSRYDGQIAIFGHQFQEKLNRLKYFMVISYSFSNMCLGGRWGNWL
ncbi:ubiquitin-activating enzyme E1 [Clonorchis sinensis]|uniref:SUMO-activating enzyme subunit 1 n=1 Tax=Clonorchis sinensis TaxID=79923 RepID=G7YKZ6_CLOSI|nr:ubiquitin-activating enzyme E1 [Clonorchis sinensis]